MVERDYDKTYNYIVGVEFLKKNLVKTTMKLVNGVTQQLSKHNLEDKQVAVWFWWIFAKVAAM